MNFVTACLLAITLIGIVDAAPPRLLIKIPTRSRPEKFFQTWICTINIFQVKFPTIF